VRSVDKTAKFDTESHQSPVNEPEAIKQRRIGPILWREKYVILASVVLLVALALLYTETAAKTYQATAIIEVSLPTGVGSERSSGRQSTRPAT
jgi:LPS O-antigen subunit length determinant protein (WzzB/FepE family)